MNRIDIVREYVDARLDKLPSPVNKIGYTHLYGVSQACAMLAMKRKENVELAVIAGMLHDIYTFTTMDSTDHAKKGALIAREALRSFGVFADEEIEQVCNAIHNHSCKEKIHSAFDEVLIDADVLQHSLHNPLEKIAPKERERFNKLTIELGL